MKATYAEDESFIPTEMGCDKMGIEEVETHKAQNNDQIGEETAQWSIAVTSQQKQKP